MRSALAMLGLPVLMVVTLVRPHVGVLSIVLLYYVRPSLWGAPDWLRPVEILTVVTLIALLLHRARGKLRLRLPGVTIAMLLLVAFAGLSSRQAALSETLGLARSASFFKCAVFAVLLAHLIDDAKKLDRLAWCMVLGTLWLVKSALVLAIQTDVAQVDSIGGQGGSSNYLALMLVVSMPILLAKAGQGRRWERLLAVPLLVLWVVTMVLTGSRGGSLAMGLVVLLHIWTSRRRFLAVVVSGLCVAAGLSLAPTGYMERMETIGRYRSDISAASRLDLWEGALEVSRGHPVLGVGPDNFRLLSLDYTDLRDEKSGAGLVTHNTYLQTLAEQGAIGLLLLLAAMGLTYRGLCGAGRSRAGDGREEERFRALARGLAIGLVGFAAHSMVMSNLHQDLIWWWFGLGSAVPGIAARLAADGKREPAPDMEEPVPALVRA